MPMLQFGGFGTAKQKDFEDPENAWKCLEKQSGKFHLLAAPTAKKQREVVVLSLCYALV
jgi:hypothetical protein